MKNINGEIRNQIAIGANCLQNLEPFQPNITPVDGNIGIGADCMKNAKWVDMTVVIGYQAGMNLSTIPSAGISRGNLLIGANNTTGNVVIERNVCLGCNATINDGCRSNVIIGYNASAAPGVINSIAIGENVVALASESFYVIPGLQPLGSGANLLYDASIGQIGPDASTRRVKKNIRPTEIDSTKLQQVEVKDFEMISSNTSSFGIIAEELELLFPHLVTYDSSGLPNGVTYHKLSVVCLMELQRLHHRIEELEAILNQYEQSK